MIKEYFFPTTIYGKDVKLDNQLFINEIVEWSKNDSGVNKTNVKGWHSQTDMNHKKEYDPLIQELFQMQNEIIQEEHLDIKPRLGNMWANINPPGGYNNGHIHPNSLFSGAYYVKASPNSGRLIMFPAWMWHKVEPNQSNDIRISVSFNFI